MDEQDLDLDTEGTEDDLDGGSDTDAEGDGSGAPRDDENTEPSGDQKRINDLMSRAQKAEAELAKLKARAQKGREQAPRQRGKNEYEEFMRDHARQLLFESEPRLAAAGLTVEDITGSSLADMRASFEAHKKVINGLESKLREDILREHGLTPDYQGSGGLDEGVEALIGGSDEDFEKLLKRRASAW